MNTITTTNIEPKEEKKNYWKYASFILGIIVILFLFGSSSIKIDYSWLALMLGMYLLYKWYMEKLETPTFQEMVDIIQKEEYKQGISLDDNPINTFGEPAGNDFFLIRFVKERCTYFVYKNKIRGKSYKDIPEIQAEIDKSEVRKTLAQKGVTEVLA